MGTDCTSATEISSSEKEITIGIWQNAYSMAFQQNGDAVKAAAAAKIALDAFRAEFGVTL